jgi:hypothetical protein
MEGFPWLLVLVGGPLILGVLFAWAKIRNSGVNRRNDPNTPSDDPSKGMPGHD